MIIFNLWAIPVGIVIWLILLGLERFSPSLVAGTHFGWALGIVATGVGGLLEFVGVSGRLFFIPIWAIGLGIICFHFGWIGTGIFAVVLVAGAVWLFKKAAKKEIADWDKVQLEFIKSPAAPVDGSEAQFWNWIKTMLFLPCWMKFTPELCDHNLKVLEALKGAKTSFSAAEIKQIEVLETFLKAAKTAAKPVGSEVKIQDPVNYLVRKKARRADAKKPFRTEPPRPIFARA